MGRALLPVAPLLLGIAAFASPSPRPGKKPTHRLSSASEFGLCERGGAAEYWHRGTYLEMAFSVGGRRKEEDVRRAWLDPVFARFTRNFWRQVLARNVEEVWSADLRGLLLHVAHGPDGVKIGIDPESTERVRARWPRKGPFGEKVPTFDEGFPLVRAAIGSAVPEIAPFIIPFDDEASVFPLRWRFPLRDEGRHPLGTIEAVCDAQGTLRMKELPSRLRLPVGAALVLPGGRKTDLGRVGRVAYELDPERRLVSYRLSIEARFTIPGKEVPAPFWDKGKKTEWRFHRLVEVAPPRAGSAPAAPPASEDALEGWHPTATGLAASGGMVHWKLEQALQRMTPAPDRIREALDAYREIQGNPKDYPGLGPGAHRAIVLALARLAGTARGNAALARLLGRASLGPTGIAVMRAWAAEEAAFRDEERVRGLGALVRRGSPAVARWASRLLARGRWEGTAAPLIARLGRETRRDRPTWLGRAIRLDLLWLLGTGADAATADDWAPIAAGTPPDLRSLDPPEPGDGPGLLFGDPVGPRALFLLDCTQPMRAPSAAGASAGLPLSRFETARRGLARAIEALPRGSHFQVLTLTEPIRPLLGTRLVETSDARKTRALRALKELEPRGMLLPDRVADAAFAIPGVDTVHLICGGLGDQLSTADLHLSFARKNYLRGIRVVVVDIASPRRKTRSPGLVKLAHMNFGWYRLIGVPRDAAGR